MSDDQHLDDSERERIIDVLGELIDAIDRRVPHMERIGENAIAGDAATLRRQAKRRIAALRAAGSPQRARDAELSSAAMTDDGGPTVSD